MKALVGDVNQKKALVGAFSVIVQPVVESMDRFAALIFIFPYCGAAPRAEQGEQWPPRDVASAAAVRDHFLVSSPVITPLMRP